MTRDIRDRLKLMCGFDVDVKRLSLNKSQVDEHKLPPNPAKLSDSRASKYVEKHGEYSWELDAIPPNVLANYVIAAIHRRLDKKQWEIDGLVEKEMRASMLAAADSMETQNEDIE